MYKVIAAVDNENGIGKNNKIPWSIPIDMTHFRETTNGHIVIMGRNTWESIPSKYKPLKNRTNIILSTILTSVHGAFVFDSIESCDRYLNYHYKNWQTKIRYVIGGADIYNQYIQKRLVRELIITKINNNYNCDTFLFDYNQEFILHSENIINNNLRISKYIYNNIEEFKILDTLSTILQTGNSRDDRTDVGTISVFGKHFVYEMIEINKDEYVIPIITTKKIFVRAIFEELLWMLNGGCSSKQLENKNINIWKGNSSREYLDAYNLRDYNEGELGPIGYGFQYKHWGAKFIPGKLDYTGEGIDQIKILLDGLRIDPYSRRHIISGWNVADLDKMAIYPCTHNYQFYVEDINNEKYLSVISTQRSGDAFLAALNWNITTTGMFLLLVATQVKMKPYKIIHNIGDLHIYNNHIEQVQTQIERNPLPFPTIMVHNKKKKIEDYKYTDLKINNYVSYESIRADMAI